ncbi:MAG: LysE family transporter [Chloroflexi bacterium]|nr:LysE family transporter [Chloroflexota bacterium]
MLELITRGSSIGFTAGATPGPLQALILSSTLTVGWRRSLPIIFSPLITDAPIIVVCVFILGQLPPPFIRAIQLFGGLFMLWLAWKTYQSWRQGVVIRAEVSDTPTGNPLPRAVLMNFLSPGPYLFWTTINGPLLLQGLNQSLWHGLGFLLAFYGSFLGLMAAQMMIFARLGSLDTRIRRTLIGISAVIMLLFGLSLLWQVVA